MEKASTNPTSNNPNDNSNSSSSSFPGWAIAVIVVGATLLLVAGLAIYTYGRRTGVLASIAAGSSVGRGGDGSVAGTNDGAGSTMAIIPPLDKKPSGTTESTDTVLNTEWRNIVWTVRASYEPTHDDEMRTNVGDEIRLRSLHDDGWAVGKILFFLFLSLKVYKYLFRV